MSETHAGLCWKDHRWMLVRSWDPELLQERIRPPALFLGGPSGTNMKTALYSQSLGRILKKSRCLRPKKL